jgi:hypothetical protein
MSADELRKCIVASPDDFDILDTMLITGVGFESAANLSHSG